MKSRLGKHLLFLFGIASEQHFCLGMCIFHMLKKELNSFFQEMKLKLKREESKKLNFLGTNSYIDVVENKADTTPSPSESVVDDEGEEILQFKYDIDTTIEENIKNSKNFTTELRHRKKAQEHLDLYQHSFKVDEKSDKLCCWLQIFTSCFSSFAFGSNDVANAGPLATICSIYETNTVKRRQMFHGFNSWWCWHCIRFKLGI